jgi:hypothetical protein
MLQLGQRELKAPAVAGLPQTKAPEGTTAELAN